MSKPPTSRAWRSCGTEYWRWCADDRTARAGPTAAGDPRLPRHAPQPADRRRGRGRAAVHDLRPRVPGPRRHPGPAPGRGAPPQRGYSRSMTSPELAEEVLDDLELLRARDPRGLLPAVAGAGAQVRETARLTEEAGLDRVTGGG